MKTSKFSLLMFVALLLGSGSGAGLCWAQESAVKNTVIDEVDFKDTEILQALKTLEAKSGLVIAPREGVSGRVTLNVQAVSALDILKIILDSTQLAYVSEDGVIRVMTAADFEKEQGYRFTDKLQAKIVQPHFIKPLDLVVKVENVKSKTGKVFLTSDGRNLVLLDDPETLAEMDKQIQRIDVLTETRIIALNYVDGSQVAEQVKPLLTPDIGQVKFEEGGNRIVLTDLPENVKAIAQVVAGRDQRREVNFDVRVAKVILADDYTDGVDWAAIVSRYQPFVPVVEKGNAARPLCSGLLTAEDYDILLDALDTVGEVEFYPSPSLKGSHNEKIYIRLNPQEKDLNVMMVAPRINGEEESEQTAPGSNKQFYLVPQVHSDGALRIKVFSPGHGDKSSAVFDFQGDHVVVIGGMFKEESLKSVRKFPLLGDLPLLGFVFRRQKTDLVKTEYVIFIRPKLESSPQP